MSDKTSDEYLIQAMLCILVLFVMATLFLGCQTLQSTARPAGCENSRIYKALPNPGVAETALLIGVSVAASESPGARETILRGLSSLQRALEDNKLTYLEFAQLVIQQVKYINEYYGAQLLVIGALTAQFSESIPIDPCDVNLIKTYLAHQQTALNS